MDRSGSRTAGLHRVLRHGASRWCLFGLAIIAGIALAGWVLFTAAVTWWPYPSELDRSVEDSVFVQDRHEAALAAFTSSDGRWRMTLNREQISPHLLNAIVAVEDARFYSHHGVDWRSAAVAAWEDIRHLSLRRGASTITMQVQRLRDPQPHTLWNKLRQAVRATQIEKRQGKDAILVEYANRAPFGGNLVGAGAASWRYFGRSCRELSLGEAALLAGLPQSPTRLRPDRFPGRARIRRDHVLNRMLACGMITQAEYDQAALEPLGASWRSLAQDRGNSAIPAADGALPTLLRVSRLQPGHVVRTTLDRSVQQQVCLAATEHLHSLSGSGISAAVVVVLDTQSAECLAAVSIQPGGGMIDLTDRSRSTGSTLKPFIYAAAFDAGICGPHSMLRDEPTAWPGYEPADYDQTFRGTLTAAEALAQSRNIPAMLILEKLGVQPAVGVMDAMGLHGLARHSMSYGLPLAIGGADATPMELAQAYAALARGGLTAPAHLITAFGVIPPRKNRPLRPVSCWQVLGALDVAHRTAAISPQAARNHVAWKTGTSSGHRDAWCAAVTRRVTVVVWLGNESGEGSPALIGQEAAAPLALRLSALLDPEDQPWPLVPDVPSIGLADREISVSELVMNSPASGQQFVLIADQTPQQQRILLKASRRGEPLLNDEPLFWFVDDQLIATATGSEHRWWDPTPGVHEIRVVDSRAHSTRCTIMVRRRQ